MFPTNSLFFREAVAREDEQIGVIRDTGLEW